MGMLLLFCPDPEDRRSGPSGNDIFLQDGTAVYIRYYVAVGKNGFIYKIVLLQNSSQHGRLYADRILSHIIWTGTQKSGMANHGRALTVDWLTIFFASCPRFESIPHHNRKLTCSPPWYPAVCTYLVIYWEISVQLVGTMDEECSYLP